LQGGTVVDATIIEASTSTKNKDGKRDVEMLIKQKKGTHLCFGMKTHIGIDS
jgi:transposase